MAGTATFTVGKETHNAPAGTLVMIPPGAPHTFANTSEQPVILLNTITPDLYVQYFRDVRDSGAPTTADQVTGLMARYASEPATTYVTEPDQPQPH